MNKNRTKLRQLAKVLSEQKRTRHKQKQKQRLIQMKTVTSFFRVTD